MWKTVDKRLAWDGEKERGMSGFIEFEFAFANAEFVINSYRTIRACTIANNENHC